MRVFITGATGFIGSAVTKELLGQGHQVVGLVRSTDSADRLRAIGAEAIVGSIEDLSVLRRGAFEANAVVHTAFFHGISQPSFGTRLRIFLGGVPSGIMGRFQNAAVDADTKAIETFGSVLQQSGGTLTIAFPTMAMRQGNVASEDDIADPRSVGGVRARSEQAALALAAGGVRTSIVRLPPSVHDDNKLGLVSMIAKISRKKGLSAYIQDGGNQWGAVHRLDAAHLFYRALIDAKPGERFHAVAEVDTFKTIAEAIGRELGLPVRGITLEEAKQHFGWLTPFAAADNPVSSHLTEERLGWKAAHSSLLSDITRNLGSAKH